MASIRSILIGSSTTSRLSPELVSEISSRADVSTWALGLRFNATPCNLLCEAPTFHGLDEYKELETSIDIQHPA